MQGQNVIHSSKDQAWRTPPEVFNPLNTEFNFKLDAATSGLDNALCPRYITPEDNALSARPWISYLEDPRWGASVWLNPPYGRDIGRWMRRAYEESQAGLVVVTLTMACTDTRWWEDYVWRAAEVRLVSGRIRFLDSRTGERKAAAPKGSAVSVFRPGHVGPPKVSLVRFPALTACASPG